MNGIPNATGVLRSVAVDDDDPIDGRDYSQRELDDIQDQYPIGGPK